MPGFRYSPCWSRMALSPDCCQLFNFMVCWEIKFQQFQYKSCKSIDNICKNTRVLFLFSLKQKNPTPKLYLDLEKTQSPSCKSERKISQNPTVSTICFCQTHLIDLGKNKYCFNKKLTHVRSKKTTNTKPGYVILSNSSSYHAYKNKFT